MQKTWNILFFRAVLSYMSAVVLLSVIFLADGISMISCVFLLELPGLVIALEIIDYLLSKIDFRFRIAYLCAEFFLMYLCFLAFAYLGKWFGFSLIHLIMFSGIFFGLFLLLHLYDYLLLRTEADTINQKLLKRKNM